MLSCRQRHDDTEASICNSNESDSSDSSSNLLQNQIKATYAPARIFIPGTIVSGYKEYTDLTFEDAVKTIMTQFQARSISDSRPLSVRSRV
jgi:hypothetical protein